MAKNMQPVLKRCRTLGVSPAAMGYSKTSNKNPGGQRRAKKSEYAMQLTEKQKVKFVYGMQEKQFRNYYEKASRAEGNTGEVLLSMLERRLDNVVYRLGYASTRREARQLVNHGHFTVNGKRVNIPSYLVKVGDLVSVCEASVSKPRFKKMKEDDAFVAAPKWLERDKNTLQGKVVAIPTKEDIDFEIAEHLIVELYSK
ncbi:MAG: 30S ribosomal protein S4 [Clostridiales bacterium]|nr:30S ribosomal protein S4 [Clostridiales bacterium]